MSGCPFEDGCIVESPTTILSDDFAYSQSGVPTLISYRPSGHYLKMTYHTNLDLMNHHFSKEVYLYSHKLYGTILILFDQIKIKPLNFEALFEALENSLDYETYHVYKELYFAIHDAKWTAKNLYEFVNRNEFSEAEAHHLNKQLHYLYLAIQESFVRLSWYGANIFPHEAHQENILQLREAIRLLRSEKITEAITELYKIDLNLYAYYYDKETYLYYMKQSLDQDERHLAWGSNLLLSGLDLYDIIEDLRGKHSWENVYSQIEALTQILKDEENRQARVIADEIHHLQHINDWMKSLYRRH